MNIRDISWRSPYAAFAPLEGAAHAHLLHGGDARESGWSMIVADPSRICRLDDPLDAGMWLSEMDALIAARRLKGATPAPFCSGLVGYVGYETAAGLERTLTLPKNPYALPVAQFAAYDAAAIFNRQAERAFITARTELAGNELEAALGVGAAPLIETPSFHTLRSNFSRAQYEAAVAEVVERIRRGDFFQANIAQTLMAESDAPISSFALFRKVAAMSDAFFAGLFQYEQGTILSNSPERFFSLDPGGRIVVEPVKGTRPRGQDGAEDLALAAQLLADPKDRAENVMIADLMRNDLSRICADFSIREEAICELMSLSRIHHLVSRISGRLRDDAVLTDIMGALFPCGSITGAPKIEAMRAIANIEQQGRGPYCGAIGYIDDHGGGDFSVAIRTMMTDASARKISIPVGGGVTLRSDPDAEYDETLVKAAAALCALGLSADEL